MKRRAYRGSSEHRYLRRQDLVHHVMGSGAAQNLFSHKITRREGIADRDTKDLQSAHQFGETQTQKFIEIRGVDDRSRDRRDGSP